MYRKALKLAVNRGATHQFSLLAQTVPVSIELGGDEVTMEVSEGVYRAQAGHECGGRQNVLDIRYLMPCLLDRGFSWSLNDLLK